MAQFGYIEIATSNGSRFSNAQDGDFLIYTDSNSQSICLGSHDGANAGLRISSNVVNCYGYYVTSNGYLTNGLSMNLLKNNPITISCITAWNSNVFAFNMSSNMPAYTFANTSGAAMLTLSYNCQIQASSNDTASLPAYTWQDSSNTGMYHYSNNQIGFTYAGSNTVVISQGGVNVASNVCAFNMTGFKNRIINGDVRVDQRNKGVMVASPTNTVTYGPDRFTTYNYGGVRISVGQSTLVTPPAGFSYAYRATVTTAATTINATDSCSIVEMVIEGAMISDLLLGTSAAQAFTISFWAYSTIAQTYHVALRNYGSSRTYVAPFTCPQNIWTYFTVPVPGDTSGTWSMSQWGLMIGITTAVGTTYSTSTTNSWLSGVFIGVTGNTNGFISAIGNTFYITGLQLEKGRIATPFEYRPYATELLLCQRYYYRRYNESPYDRFGLMNADDTTNGTSIISFPTKMVSIPSSFTISSTSHFVFGGATVSSISKDATSTSLEAGVIRITGTGFTASKVYPIFANNQTVGNAWIAFDSGM